MTSTLLAMLNVSKEPAALSKSAVLVIDAQREYLDGAVPLCGIDKALVEIRKLLERARKEKAPIFHIVHHTMPGAPIFDPEGPMSDIIEAVRPVGEEAVVTKNHPSAFVNTPLETLLRETGKNELIIVGFMTHMCVNATTRSAVDLGFSPTIIASACATRDLPLPDGTVIPAKTVHQSNLASLGDLLACITESEAGIS